MAEKDQSEKKERSVEDKACGEGQERGSLRES